jgi:hypothetical protein
MHTRFWWGNLRERGYLEDIGIAGRTILKCIFRKEDGRVWIGLIWPRMGTVGGLS